jgi:hypothetical protein
LAIAPPEFNTVDLYSQPRNFSTCFSADAPRNRSRRACL